MLTKKLMDAFYRAWEYLELHDAFKDKDGFERFEECLVIEVMKVNPKTMSVDTCEKKNTHVEIWLECGEWLDDGDYASGCHNYKLDCGGDTFEEAIIKLAQLVKKHLT